MSIEKTLDELNNNISNMITFKFGYSSFGQYIFNKSKFDRESFLYTYSCNNNYFLLVALKNYKKKITNPDILDFYNNLKLRFKAIKSNKDLYNTEFHEKIIKSDKLKHNYIRYENVFGVTPDELLINKTISLYFALPFFVGFNDVFDDIKTNLLKSIRSIDRTKIIVPILPETSYNSNIIKKI